MRDHVGGGFWRHPLVGVVLTAVLTALLGAAVTVVSLSEKISVLTERVNLVTSANAARIERLENRIYGPTARLP